MAGRLGHIDDARRVGHVPRNGLRVTNYAYGFGNPFFWLEADKSGISTATNLGALSFITEIISGKKWIQATAANQPRFLTSDSNFNNHPSFDFYTTARRMIPQIGNFSFGNNYTICYAYKLNVVAGGSTANVIFGSAAAINRGFVCGIGTTVGVSPYGAGWIAGNGVGFNSSINDTLPHLLVMTQDYIYIDGVSETVYGTSNLFASQDFNQLGTGRTGALGSLNGQFPLALVFPYKFSASEAVELSNRINQKYAIY